MSLPSEMPAAGLRALTQRTLESYGSTADSFWEGTRSHDVAQNYAALLQNLEGPAPRTILDLGCGPGRDLYYFRQQGHTAVGLDGCLEFVEMARAYSGCEVWHQDFLALELGVGRFDGIFANASLFHVPSAALPSVLERLFAALTQRGVLFSSNPRGHNEEGFSRDRYGCFWDLPTWSGHVTAAGFAAIAHYYRPDGKPCAEQPWLATIWRKP